MSKILREVEIGALALKGLFGAPENPRRSRDLRSWQRQRPVKPAEQLCRGGAPQIRIGDASSRSSHPRGGDSPKQRLRHSFARKRLLLATAWAREQAETARLPIGYFGASTGAGAALVAAANDGGIFAVVSRGGRPDLAGDALERVRSPTLLIVGGQDYPVIALNREAQQRLKTESELVIVPGATHLFEEPGALDQVIAHASRWFLTHLPQAERHST